MVSAQPRQRSAPFNADRKALLTAAYSAPTRFVNRQDGLSYRFNRHATGGDNTAPRVEERPDSLALRVLPAGMPAPRLQGGIHDVSQAKESGCTPH